MPMPGVPPGDDGRDAAIIDWVATETMSNSGLIYSFLFIVLSDLLDCNFFTIVDIDALLSRLAIHPASHLAACTSCYRPLSLVQHQQTEYL